MYNYKDLSTMPIEQGYINPDPEGRPLRSAGNLLEWTGKLLLSGQLEQQILKGLNENEIRNGFIPRTKYIGEENPNNFESKKGRWERYKLTWISNHINYGVVKEDRNKSIWYRTDVSYSQHTFLIMGLFNHRDYIPASALCVRMLQRIIADKWVIKNYNGDSIPNGKYYCWGNTGLRFILLTRYCEYFNMNPNISWFTKLKLRLNYKIMKNIKAGKEEDIKTTYMLLHELSKLDNNKNLKLNCLHWFRNYFLRHSDKFHNPKNYEDTIDKYYIESVI
jgi:hypothetical protein